MKLSAPACVLSDAISLASVIKRGGNSPCFAHLATTGDAVSITCTENTVGTIATSVSPTIQEPGEIAVSIARLATLLSSFTADAIVDIEGTTGAVNVVSGTSRLRLPAVSVVESPAAITIDQEVGRVEISSADLLQLLEPLAVADRTRLQLTGVFLHGVGHQLVAVSTDGIRLIRTSVAASTFSEDRTLIVPTEVGIVVRRLLQKAGASRVTLRRSRSLIAFEAPSFSFTARLIDSSFPAYEGLIPPPAPNSVFCNRGDLLAALSRLGAAASSNDTALVALSWGDGRCLDLHLARRPLDGADVIAAEVHGSAEAALSLPQFAALLKEFSDEHVLLETANELPVVICGASEKLALIVRSKWNFGSRGRRT
ncbi:DNA polymerase III subunit beta [Bradyrhizobium sp. sBnM-33]|uniref:DNA polymerase III subunit beta n=1 Tax=Bradyrhizobium sp. sBnM-33 TaxID=2831780 RepID=UPI001BCFCD86|nr:DNA polymerase III subunit beta [Bradyrhizobium sp. sBnM-33]WOH51919.1 DNA polymerase III subunit beta [Bradyrhizobium sp. sBnM-33]